MTQETLDTEVALKAVRNLLMEGQFHGTHCLLLARSIAFLEALISNEAAAKKKDVAGDTSEPSPVASEPDLTGIQDGD